MPSRKVSDKWISYHNIYNRALSRFRLRRINLLEIGVQNGGSLEKWAHYFTHARNIIGCDIDHNCSKLQFNDPRIRVVIGDACIQSTQNEILKYCKKLDVVIDDGSHLSKDVLSALMFFFPKLRSGGVYIIEDLHTSYWREYGGGLWREGSSIEFLKFLIDIVNLQNWGVELPESSIIESNANFGDIAIETFRGIHSIAFFNSMCVISKARRSKNTLGLRSITGTEALVNSDLPKHGSILQVPPQIDNVAAVKSRLRHS